MERLKSTMHQTTAAYTSSHSSCSLFVYSRRQEPNNLASTRIRSFSPPVLDLFPLYLVLPAADMKAEMAFFSGLQPRSCAGENQSSAAAVNQARVTVPNPGSWRGFTVSGVVRQHCKIQTKGCATAPWVATNQRANKTNRPQTLAKVNSQTSRK